MLISLLSLITIYLIHLYIAAWIRYYNKTDERFGNTIWRWSYDYPVKGVRDISELDDKEFVKKRRVRNRTVTLMYWNFFLGFTVSMHFISVILKFILNN